MATIYTLPEGFQEPPDFEDSMVDGRYDMALDDRLHNEWLDELADWCRNNSPSDIAGEVVSFGYADGAAQYMVWQSKPLSLIHLPIHDAWSLPEWQTRGLRTSDIRPMVEGKKLFGERRYGRETRSKFA